MFVVSVQSRPDLTIVFSSLARQFGEDAVEHTQTAPADEAVVDCLVRAVTLGGIAPHQTVLDDVNNARHDPLVIDPGDAVRQWKKRLDPAHLRLAQQKVQGAMALCARACIRCRRVVSRQRFFGIWYFGQINHNLAALLS
jgi:hypothetical protein